MALDTRGLMHGAAQGFEMVDQYYNRQEQSDRADQRLEMQQETHERQQQQAQREQEMQQAKFTLSKIAQGVEPSQDEMQFLRDNPKYLPALDPETDQDIENAQRVIDPEDSMGANDPEALSSMNRLFGNRINRGSGGNKKISGIFPGSQEGNVAIDLEVEGEDGQSYNAPMTRNRGAQADGDDEVLETPVEDLVNQTQGYRMLRNAFRTPEAQRNASKVLAAITGETTEGISINDRLVNPQTGEVIADFSGQDGQDGSADWRKLDDGRLYNQRTGETKDAPGLDVSGSGGGDAPADVQTANWLVERGVAENLDQAWSLVNESRTDPTRFVANYVDQEMKAQENSNIYPGDDRYKTTEEMRENALGALKTIRQSTRGTQNPSPEPDPDRPAGKATENPDGSYSGPVDRGSGGEMPTVRTDRDYESLPPGTVFVDENGQKYRKPDSE